MGTINDLNTVTELADEDKFVIWQKQAGATRAITAENAADYFGLSGGPYQPEDELLTAIAAQGPNTTNGDFIQLTGADTVRVRKLTVATYAALTNISAAFRFDDMLVYVASRATDGDGGEGWFRFDAASSATADGGTILAPDAGTGRWFRQYSGALNVKWFGATGSGATDDEAALILAFAAAAGKRMYFPKGTYRVEFTSTTCFTLPADVVIEGEDRDSTIIDFVPSSTTYRNGFSGADGLTVRDLTIKMSIPAGGQGSIFVAGSRMKLQDCLFDGTVTDNGVTASHTAYMLAFPSTGTQEDIHISGCEIKRFTFDILKANSDTSTQRRITIVDNDFHTTYREAATFNSPGGVMEDVRCNFNRFRAHAGIGLGSTSLFVAFASVNRFQIIGNTFSGAITDAIHIEENCIDGVVTGNILDVDGNGIVILENNIAGSYTQPDGIVVANNIVRKDGTNRGAGKFGIWLVNNASADLPGKRIVIEGNQVHSFDDGYKIEANAVSAIVLRGNLAYDCESGFWNDTAAASIVFAGNTSASCAIGIYSAGGLWKDHKFVGCTTNVDGVTYHVTLQDPVVELPLFNVGAGSTTNTNIFPQGANDRQRADITITGFTSVTADRSTVVDTVTWDGTTFNRTQNLSFAPGGIVLSARDNSSNLALRIFSTSAVTGVKISAAFDGVVVVAV